MNLYRIIHKSLAGDLRDQPQKGAFVEGKYAYLLVYDSFAMALLEHPFFKLVLGFPDTFVMVILQLPNVKPQLIKENRAYLYNENTMGNRKLGRWSGSFLKHQSALVAEFPSRNWPSQSNFLINVCHPQFREVEIIEISEVQ